MGLLETLGLPRRGGATAEVPLAPPPGADPMPPPPASGSKGSAAASPPGDPAAAAAALAIEIAEAIRFLSALKDNQKKTLWGNALADLDAKAKAAAKLPDKAAALKQIAAASSGVKEIVKRGGEAIALEAAEAVKQATLEAQKKAAEKSLKDNCDTPLAGVTTLLGTQNAAVKGIFGARLQTLKTRREAIAARLAEADYATVLEKAPKFRNACADLTSAINGYAAEYPAYKARLDEVNAMLARMKANPLFDGDGKNGIKDLEAAVGAAEALGPERGFAAARNSLNAVVVDAQKLRDDNKAYADFTAEKDKVQALVDALKAHGQAARLGAELADLAKDLTAAETLARGAKGGALKGLTALKTVRTECASLKALAEKMAKAEAQLPDLKKKLEAAGVDKAKVEETSRYALKVLVEEDCTPEAAVKMARDAGGFKDEGLSEPDAIMSSRVKKSLEDGGLTEEHARAIGKNVRAGGTSNADDAKALAQAMKGVSKKAIDTLNDAGIVSECCRGPITDAMPELAGVQPRGWPDTASWDQVPGVYNPSVKKVVVGTMDKGGKRAVPGPGEGPLKHGATDLFGHEGGHAFDAAGGGLKSTHAAFLAARTADVTAGNMVGGAAGGKDDYFMTVTEGGANSAGATSETFAESFAMHFAKKSRWAGLEDFWKANPWGV